MCSSRMNQNTSPCRVVLPWGRRVRLPGGSKALEHLFIFLNTRQEPVFFACVPSSSMKELEEGLLQIKANICKNGGTASQTGMQQS